MRSNYDNSIIKLEIKPAQFFNDILKSSYFIHDFFTYYQDGNLEAIYCIILRKGIEILQKAIKKYEDKIIESMYACETKKYDVIRMMNEQF